jgi:hypothetical protein
MARDRVEVFKRKELKKLGRWGARTPLVQEATIIEGPLSLAKKLASGEIGIADIRAATPLWEKAQAIIFAKTLARLSSDIKLKRDAATTISYYLKNEEAVDTLLYQERVDAAVFALVEHSDDNHVFKEASRLEKETVDAYRAGVLADHFISFASLCQGGRVDLFLSVANSLKTRASQNGMPKN